MSSLHVITSIDTMLFHWCQRRLQMHAAVALTSRYISRLGNGSVYIFILLLVCFDAKQGTEFLYLCIFAFAIVWPLYLLLKNIVRRDRPSERLSLLLAVHPLESFSFPSGHTAFAFAFAALLSEIYPVFGFIAYSIATLIGLSRVLLGVHYPTDTLAGALLGVACADVSMGLVL